MHSSRARLLALAIASLATLSACARSPEPAATASVSTAALPDAGTTAAAATTTPTARPALPRVVVHKSASCGCCALWVKHLRDEGFQVEMRNQDNLNPVKERVGVPVGKGSCHTAEVGGYFVEGHVPAGDIKRLLAEQPDAKGLVLPGMPAGSPGMELQDGTTQPYTVELVRRDDTTTAFAQH